MSARATNTCTAIWIGASSATSVASLGDVPGAAKDADAARVSPSATLGNKPIATMNAACTYIGTAIDGGVVVVTCTEASRGRPRNTTPKARTTASALTAPTNASSAAVVTSAAFAAAEGASPERRPE